MHLFYIDESGNTGAELSSTIEPVHWLCALGVTAAAVHSIEADMLGIAVKYFRRRGQEPDFEFHGSEIFSGRGDARLLTVAQRIALFEDIISLVPRHNGRLWVRGIDKPLHKERARLRGYPAEHPHKLGFMYLAESIDSWLEARQPDPLLFPGPPTPVFGLLVSDTQDEVARDLVGRFANWRQSGTDHGYRSRDLKYLIDTVHCVPSEDSWLIQLVDCIAYLRNRVSKIRRAKGVLERNYSPSDREVLRLWTAHCGPSVVDERIWPS